MHKTERAMHKILWDFEIQTDHKFPARRQDLELVKKEKRFCYLMDFTVLADDREKMNENQKIEKYLNLA